MSKLRILERMAGAVGFACLFVGLITALTPAQATTSVERAHAIGVDAYTYLYSLVTMDVTRKQLTNAPVDLPGLAAPPNVFSERACLSDGRHAGWWSAPTSTPYIRAPGST